MIHNDLDEIRRRCGRLGAGVKTWDVLNLCAEIEQLRAAAAMGAERAASERNFLIAFAQDIQRILKSAQAIKDRDTEIAILKAQADAAYAASPPKTRADAFAYVLDNMNLAPDGPRRVHGMVPLSGDRFFECTEATAGDVAFALAEMVYEQWTREGRT